MSIKRYSSGAFQDVEEVNKFTNSAWGGVESGKKFINGAWEEVWSSFPGNFLFLDGIANQKYEVILGITSPGVTQSAEITTINSTSCKLFKVTNKGTSPFFAYIGFSLTEEVRNKTLYIGGTVAFDELDDLDNIAHGSLGYTRRPGLYIVNGDTHANLFSISGTSSSKLSVDCNKIFSYGLKNYALKILVQAGDYATIGAIYFK